MLQGAVCPVTAAVTALGLSATAYAAWKAEKKPSALSFAAVSALVFAGQMLNFPVQFGTSGHILGATLAVALLGSSFGVLSMSLAVLMQCLVFADGGVSVLGANLLNMALLAALPAIVVREFLLKDGAAKNNAAVTVKASFYGTAALVSVLLAAAACSVELSAAGAVAFDKVLPSMLFVHLLIGLCEGVITFVLYPLLAAQMQTADNKRGWLVPLGTAVIAAFVLSPFASQSPDGLEYIASVFGFLHTSAPLFSVPFADYSVPGVPAENLSTALAGLFGVVLMFVSGYGLRRLFQ
jgi:cobalt/nickel transport system permease protein